MPLNGSDVASKPVGTTASPNTTIQSAPYNSVIDDIYAILNTTRTRYATAAQGTKADGSAQKANNLSDLANEATARTNIGLGNVASSGANTTVTGDLTITGTYSAPAGSFFQWNIDGVGKAWLTSVGKFTVAGEISAAGGTMTGDLTLNGDPTTALMAATKGYVDGLAIGVGQTWQNVSASRAFGTVYQNTTGKPIMVVISRGSGGPKGSNVFSFDVSANGVTFEQIGNCLYDGAADVGWRLNPMGPWLVPVGHYYRATWPTISTFDWWKELR